MFERIKDRYNKGYVRDDQLQKYVKLEVITQEQAKEMQAECTANKVNLMQKSIRA